MSKNHTQADKNLTNVVEDLKDEPINSLDAQQRQQSKMDRRKEDLENDKGYKQSENHYQ